MGIRMAIRSESDGVVTSNSSYIAWRKCCDERPLSCGEIEPIHRSERFFIVVQIGRMAIRRPCDPNVVGQPAGDALRFSPREWIKLGLSSHIPGENKFPIRRNRVGFEVRSFHRDNGSYSASHAAFNVLNITTPSVAVISAKINLVPIRHPPVREKLVDLFSTLCITGTSVPSADSSQCCHRGLLFYYHAVLLRSVRKILAYLLTRSAGEPRIAAIFEPHLKPKRKPENSALLRWPQWRPGIPLRRNGGAHGNKGETARSGWMHVARTGSVCGAGGSWYPDPICRSRHDPSA